MFKGDFKMALANLRSARWRSTLTMLGIIIGITSVVTIASLGEGLKRQIAGQVNQLGADVLTIRSGKIVTKNAQGQITEINPLAFVSASTLSEKDVEDLRKLPQVEGAAPMSLVTNSATFGDTTLNNLYVVGTSPEANQLIGSKVSFGAFFGPDELNQPQAVIGSAVAERLFGEINPVGRTFIINNTEFSVRAVLDNFAGGVLSTTGIDLNFSVFIPYPLALQVSENKAQIAQILVKTKGDIDGTSAAISHQLLQNHQGQDNFTILKQDELIEISQSLVNKATGFISGIAAISLLVGGIGVMNIMLVNVSERTREIGIRKAVGASNRQILSQFLTEGLVISLAGGFIGVLTSIIINFLMRIYSDFKPVVTIQIILIATLVTVVLGVIFAMAPAVKAARKNPIEALRGE